jgi:hypothetical protein
MERINISIMEIMINNIYILCSSGLRCIFKKCMPKRADEIMRRLIFMTGIDISICIKYGGK